MSGNIRKKMCGLGAKRSVSFVLLASLLLLMLPAGDTHALEAPEVARTTAMTFRVAVIGLNIILGKALVAVAQLADFVLRLPVAFSPVVQTSWGVVRDFSNMFFIVFLIIMAFATIFDVGSFGYGGYDIGSLMGRFLIAALLINFSLVIGQEIIGWTQVLNSTFLVSMGPLGDAILVTLQPHQLLNQNDLVTDCLIRSPEKLTTAECGTGKFAQIINGFPVPQIVRDKINEAISTIKLLAQIAGDSFEEQLIGIVSSLFTTIMFAIVIVSLFVPIVFGIIRIPFLWFLLIMSPLAWLTMVLPSTRHINQAWWKQFWGWNLFLPIYLFFLTIGLVFLTRQHEVMSAIINAWAGNPGGSATAITTRAMAPIEIIFYYVVAGIIFIGGAGMAFKSSFLAGTAAAGAAGWARGAVGRFTGVTAIGRGAKQRLETAQKTGVKAFGMQVYGGQASLDKSSASWQARFGDSTAKERLLAKSVKDAKDKFKDENVSKSSLEDILRKGNIPESIAAGERLMDDDNLQLKDISVMSDQYKKISPAATTAFHERTEKYMNKLAEKGFKSGESKDVMGLAGKLKTDPAKQKEFIEKLADKACEKNVVAAAELAHEADPSGPSVFDRMKEYMRGMGPDDFASQTPEVIANQDFQLAIQTSGIVSQKKKEAILLKRLTPDKRQLYDLIP